VSTCIGTQARERSAVVVDIAGRKKLSVLILDLTTSFSSLLSSSFRSGALFDEEDKDEEEDAGWLFVSESFSRIRVVLFIVSSIWVMLCSFKRTSRMCL
jgi:hypothetical protein